jgi:hypothetical protein
MNGAAVISQFRTAVQLLFNFEQYFRSKPQHMQGTAKSKAQVQFALQNLALVTVPMP